MCTVTWVRQSDDLVLLMNRDELWSRGPAEPPRTLNRDGIPVIAPIDSDAGGTWISANAAGLVLCLLNRYPDAEPGWRRPDGDEAQPTPARQSRGRLVLQLAGGRSCEGIADELVRADLLRYAPFTLLAIDPLCDPLVHAWDGYRLQVDRAHAPVVSSSFDSAAVLAARRDTYQRMIGPGPTPAQLRAYHQSHDPERGPYSVCVHREDGGSRSLTEIRVNTDEVAMRYSAGPPCESAAMAVATLNRYHR
ncbi:MAG: hypothetical protein EA382_10860 [Spirochaetaceae bacterium]|nr:MAG: hypothetical protein EA382_10860 [Spirochaetaceae bacterium]